MVGGPSTIGGGGSQGRGGSTGGDKGPETEPPEVPLIDVYKEFGDCQEPPEVALIDVYKNLEIAKVIDRACILTEKQIKQFMKYVDTVKLSGADQEYWAQKFPISIKGSTPLRPPQKP
ncbi:hypothetical protein MRX96_030442 [Rhipicephalus microplus]